MDVSVRNQRVFSHARTTGEYRRQFTRQSGFLDPGERAALLLVAAASKRPSILDVGVGPGRTTALLKLMSDDYFAVDYSRGMLDEFERNYPDTPYECLDARDLSALGDNRFGLILFSNNGIDSVNHADRPLVLEQFVEHLSPGGHIVFSTLNRNGPSFGEHPFELHRPTRPPQLSLRAAVVSGGRRLLQPDSIVRGLRNWSVTRRATDDHGTWAMGPLAAHDYSLVVHFTTPTDLLDLLERAGLRPIAIFSDGGTRVGTDSDAFGVDNFTVVAQRTTDLT